MTESRDILLQLRFAKQNIEHAKSLIILDGLIPIREFRDYIKAATSALETADSLIRGEGKERG